MKYTVISIIACLLAGCTYVNQKLGLEDDNAYEETLEELIETAIEMKTGFRPDLDLTPGSEERPMLPVGHAYAHS